MTSPIGRRYFNGCGNNLTQAITQYDERHTQVVEGTERRPVVRIVSGQGTRSPDTVAVEAALSISVKSSDNEEQRLGLTMRTPGNDEELVLGFLHSEGIIDSMDDVTGLEGDSEVIAVNLSGSCEFVPSEHVRRSTMTSSCGICGRDSISSLLHIHGPPLSSSIRVSHEDVARAVTSLRKSQQAFDLTGGTHACARVLPGGDVVAAYEDIGRHNAMDKLVGNALQLGNVPVGDEMVVVSGRASFELVQKALRVGFPIFVSVGAPSSLAVDLANEHGMTLICFAAESRMTVFSGSGRVITQP